MTNEHLGQIHQANAQVIVNRLIAIRDAAPKLSPSDLRWQLGCLINEIERGHGLRSSDYDAMIARSDARLAAQNGETK